MEIEGSPRSFPVTGLCLAAVAVILACLGAAYSGLLGREPGFLLASLLTGVSLLALTIAGPLSWALRNPHSPRRRLIAALRLLVFPLAIAVPLLVFVGSMSLVPAWKGDAPNGWLSCIHAGNWLFIPFVLWACAAMYARHAAGVAAPWRWVTLGLYAGAIASGILSLMLLLQMSQGKVPGTSGEEALLFSIVPLATFGAYLAAALHRRREAPVAIPSLAALLAASGLTSLVHALIAIQTFSRLPDTQPDCYVVTAASNGHARIVKPLFVTSRQGRLIRVNAQLLILWELERRWAERSPRTHRVARATYDIGGPVLARAIAGPLRADLAYLALKPLEWIARRLVR